MALYRKLPVTIEAIQFTGDNVGEIAEMLNVELGNGNSEGHHESLVIYTLEGDVTAKISDWIIRGVAGEGHPCRDDIFRATYEPVLENEAP